MHTPQITLATLRQYAVKRTLFAATTLPDALSKIGFVQIDPIKAPAPAQDLILRQRVHNYQKGDVERSYPQLALEEAFFINHGYLPRGLATTLWSNKPPSEYLSSRTAQVKKIQAFARDNHEVHPKILNQHIGHRVVANNWGGTGQEGTQIMQRMHSNGMLRIVRREKGLRIYGLPVSAPLDLEPIVIVEACIQTLARTYAPFTHSSLIYMTRLLGQSRPDLKPHIQSTLKRAHELLAHTEIDRQRWYWPQNESSEIRSTDVSDTVHLLAPFDPLVWDRARFELFWGWTYKFEAYKPAHERKLGYYALPLIWRGDCIGWGNLSVNDSVLHAELGYIAKKPTSKIYQQALEKELTGFAAFVRCQNWTLL